MELASLSNQLPVMLLLLYCSEHFEGGKVDKVGPLFSQTL